MESYQEHDDQDPPPADIDDSKSFNQNQDEVEAGDSHASGNDSGETNHGDIKTGAEGALALQPTGENMEEDDEILPYCLICNHSVHESQPEQQQIGEYRHYVSNVASIPVDKSELKLNVFIALDVDVEDGSTAPIADPNFKLPLCSNCKYKCGQLNNISSQIRELEREFDRIREAMAFTICDTVGDEAHRHEYTDENDPLRKARQDKQKDVNEIQEFVHEHWWYRYPADISKRQLPVDNHLDNMRDAVRNLWHLAPPCPGNELNAAIQPAKKNPQLQQIAVPKRTLNKLANPIAPVSQGIVPTRIRRTAESVQRERSEMRRRGIPIPDLFGPRKTNSQTIRKQFNSFNQNGFGNRFPPRQIHASLPRVKPVKKAVMGGKFLQQASTQAFNNFSSQEDNFLDDINTNESYNEDNFNYNESMDDMSEDFDGVDAGLDDFGDWNSNDNEQLLNEQLDQLGGDAAAAAQFFEGGGHFMEGGGHFMEGGFDESEHSENMDDEGSVNDPQDDVEYHQNEEGLYVCPFCSKQFIHKYPYRDHLKTHTGEGPKCHICGKIFPKNHNLMLHMRTHTGEKPFHCEICHKGFADKSNLKVHMRVHTGERPYQCECGLSFVNSSRLVVHRRLHTGEKPYPCDICQKPFVTVQQFQSHRKNHFVNSKLREPTPMQVTEPKPKQVKIVKHQQPPKQRRQSEQEQQQAQVATTSSRSGRPIIPKRRV